ncbi:unnamed protein product [Lactuca saligna]|uniref:Uncharacterized protein n=1 Tax=Lactuca saligna TaxID=75948 RepID=A0AA35Y1I8_LACSI|nr:unnamed protein product [Lactuca saligna]
MYKCVSGASKLIREYKKHPTSGARVITPEMQQTLDDADKAKKWGKPKHLKEEVNFSIPTPPPSPTSTSVPITTTPFPPPITTQSPPVTTRQPIFTETITTTTTGKPSVNVNGSYVGAKNSSFATTYTTSPISPQPQHSSEDPLSADGLDFDMFHYSAFSIQEYSDDDAPLTKRHLKYLQWNLDSLLASSTVSSSQAYSEASVKNMLNTLVTEHAANLQQANKSLILRMVKEHAANLQQANKAVESSTLSNQQATEKSDKLISDTKTFISELNTAAEANVVRENEAISKLNNSLRTE